MSVWRGEPALLDAIADDIRSAMKPLLFGCPRLVGLDAFDAHLKLSGDLLVAESLSHELEHVLFAPAEFAAIASLSDKASSGAFIAAFSAIAGSR